MACAPCQAAAAAAQNQSVNQQQQLVAPLNSNCGITKHTLTTWYKVLDCVKRNQYGERVNLAEVEMNQMLGIIQSGLNYPDNYCYYFQQLEHFQNVILPLIVNNVPECLS